MEQEFPVPGFPKYTVTADGKVYSYFGKGGSRRELKIHVFNKHPYGKHKSANVKLWNKNEHGEKTAKFWSYPRLILAAKLGRPLEDWEQARHLNGRS